MTPRTPLPPTATPVTTRDNACHSADAALCWPPPSPPIAALKSVPTPPTPTRSPAPNLKSMTPEEQTLFIRADTQRHVQERSRACEEALKKEHDTHAARLRELEEQEPTPVDAHPHAPSPPNAFRHAPPFRHAPHHSRTCPRPASRHLMRADTPRPPHTRPALSAGPPTRFHIARPPLDAPRPHQHAQPLFNVLPTPQAHAPTSPGMPCPLGMRPPHEDVPLAHHSCFPAPLDAPHPVPHIPVTLDMPQPLSMRQRPIFNASHPFPKQQTCPVCIRDRPLRSRPFLYSSGTLMHEGMHLLKNGGIWSGTPGIRNSIGRLSSNVCSYSLQLLLGNQQQILTAHFHVSPFAFPLGRVLVLLQQAEPHARTAPRRRLAPPPPPAPPTSTAPPPQSRRMPNCMPSAFPLCSKTCC